jgi:hypothetical protein
VTPGPDLARAPNGIGGETLGADRFQSDDSHFPGGAVLNGDSLR